VFGRWGEMFGDDVVAAMIDRLVHHAEVIPQRRQLPTQRPRPRPCPHRHDRRPIHPRVVSFACRQLISFRVPLTSKSSSHASLVCRARNCRSMLGGFRGVSWKA
jgi:hypothetical protein